MIEARVLSIQVGRGRTFPSGGVDDKPWRSAIAKEAVLGAVPLGPEGLEGDQQVDRRYHGGPQRALLVYAAAHYPNWERELHRTLPYGMFGENLTVDGLDEETACIGDSYALAGAVVQVSQPRMPCVKLARRIGEPDMVARALATRRTGFYLRVLTVGDVAAGPLKLLERPFPELTVAAGLSAVVEPRRVLPLLPAFLACPLLSEDWRNEVARARARVVGPGVISR